MKPRIDLLKSLEAALRKLPDDCPGFNMGVWADKKVPESPMLDCGTSACAIGLASTLPDWKEAGLSIIEVKKDFGGVAMALTIAGGADSLNIMPQLAKLLGIPRSLCEDLFYPDDYDADPAVDVDDDGELIIPPFVVANRIKQAIADLEKQA